MGVACSLVPTLYLLLSPTRFRFKLNIQKTYLNPNIDPIAKAISIGYHELMKSSPGISFGNMTAKQQ